MTKTTIMWKVLFGLFFLFNDGNAFTPPGCFVSSMQRHEQQEQGGHLSITKTATATTTQLFSSTPAPKQPPPEPATEEMIEIPDKEPSGQWELDCYSRPVVTTGGKKLWEVLVTDSNSSFRYIKTLPSNQVNSKELRKTIEELIERADAKPSIVRFFRGAMFNMMNIALSDLDVVARPSRCTYSVAEWLEERHRDVYPNMEGYRANMVGDTGSASAFFASIRKPGKLPDALRGEKYAFVALPLAEFLPGGGVNQDNIGVGRLCPVDPKLPADSFVQGVVILTQRPDALASWLAGTEVAAMTADLRQRNLMMETDIDTLYLMAKLNDIQRVEGEAFEEGKDILNGLHFVSVQRDEDDDPAGFWLMRKLPKNI